MLYQITYASLITIFFNVGFVGVLQRLMHVVDPDLDGHNLYPRKTELVYTAYFIVMAFLLLGLARVLPDPFVSAMLVNCDLLILISYTNAVKTLLNIVIAAVASCLLFAGLLSISAPIILASMVFFIICLVIEWRYFFPFDEHPTARLIAKMVIGLGFWTLMHAFTPMRTQVYTAMLICYTLAALANFGYMYLLRREHVLVTAAEHNVYHDGLTNAGNWLAYRKAMTKIFATRDTEPFSIIALDIDHFKAINDQHGHQAGNTVLITFVDSLKYALAELNDRAELYRTGGEEFIIILPGSDLNHARNIAEACRDHIQSVHITIASGATLHITASMGVTTALPNDEVDKQIYQRADGLLYTAKREGRNQVVG